MSTDLSEKISNKMRNALYTQWFKLTSDFNPSPTFEKVFEQFQFILSALKNEMQTTPSSNYVDFQMT